MIDNGVGEEMPIEGKVMEIKYDLNYFPYPKIVIFGPDGKRVNTKPVSHILVYLDVGRWGGDHKRKMDQRDFGLIWGPWVALCEFSSQPRRYVMKITKAGNSPIDDVIKGLHSKNSSVFVRKKEYAPSSSMVPHKTLDWNTVYVILGDLHLPVVKYGAKRSGSGWEPREGRNDFDPSNPTSVDEWYDHYAHSDIFSHWRADRDLRRFLNRLIKIRLPDGRRIHFVQLGDLYELWNGLDAYFVKSSPHYVDLKSGTDSEGLTAGDFIQTWVSKTNNVFPKLTKKLNKLKSLHKVESTFIHGNHDNYLAKDALGPLGILPGLPPREPLIRHRGVFMEHGHQVDSYNRDGKTEGHKLTQANFKANNQLRPIADYLRVVGGVTDPRKQVFMQSMVPPYTLRPNFVIYAMGHTHSPFLTKAKLVPK